MGRKDSSKAVSLKNKKKKCRSSSDSSSSSLSSIDEKTKRKLKKIAKKLMKKAKDKKQKKRVLKKLMKDKLRNTVVESEEKNKGSNSSSYDIDISLMENPKILVPMTKEEWEKQQNTFKRVFDEETGRMRLIRGSGEILEECVSKERHLMINKQATKGDGEFFQKRMFQQLK